MVSVSEAEILRLVAERESARQARRFEESDSIREQLRSYGVELYDKEREWRCSDGRRGVLFTAGPVHCLLTDYEIQTLVATREEARLAKDFSHADIVRDDLRRQGVELDDKSKTWRTGNGRSGSYSGQLSSNSTLHDADIRTMVADRERARANQDFTTADDIRSRLGSLGVEIFDNQRIWKSSDGRQGVIVTGGVEISHCALQDSEISVRVQAREDARSQKDFERADRIRDELRRSGVELLDSEHRWQTADGRSGSYSRDASSWQQGSSSTSPSDMALSVAQVIQNVVSGAQSSDAASLASALASAVASGQGGGGSSLSDASIEALIYGREVERNKRDFAAADLIRQDLKAHGVEVWDKQRTWNCSDGRSGVYTSPSAPSASNSSRSVPSSGARQGSRTGSMGGSLGMSSDLAAVMALAGRIS